MYYGGQNEIVQQMPSQNFRREQEKKKRKTDAVTILKISG